MGVQRHPPAGRFSEDMGYNSYPPQDRRGDPDQDTDHKKDHSEERIHNPE
eukprot:CAMPEP_0185746670 /NCGR_PEP_ID=MMETSP1174-20130828/5285_1 /TAXON_ID=35687 /ORGANISM="Dictyocha speculum, Strain CCMP1381" /LENGTH=49 /DNA_ID=CAMNT_0028421509 /DNA_START=184 /DNA_END=333 /DNA_ORIENTATION=+